MYETVFDLRDGVVKIIRKLDAATRLAQALEQCLPAMCGLGDKRRPSRTRSSRSRPGKRLRAKELELGA